MPIGLARLSRLLCAPGGIPWEGTSQEGAMICCGSAAPSSPRPGPRAGLPAGSREHIPVTGYTPLHRILRLGKTLALGKASPGSPGPSLAFGDRRAAGLPGRAELCPPVPGQGQRWLPRLSREGLLRSAGDKSSGPLAFSSLA